VTIIAIILAKQPHVDRNYAHQIGGMSLQMIHKETCF